MSRLSITEKIILCLVTIMLTAGYVFFYTNLHTFELYVQEDGVVEWLTVLGLLLGCIVCLNRFFTLRKQRSAWFLTVTIGLAILLFFAAGEEVSWGQRIFGIKSSEFFLEKNAQGETNLHNLVVDGVKLNKLIFSIGLVAALGIYLLVFPILYNKNNSVRSWIDKSGIPLAQVYQIVTILALFIITELLRHGKRAELLEAGITLLFFLIIRYPKNREIFNSRDAV